MHEDMRWQGELWYHFAPFRRDSFEVRPDLGINLPGLETSRGERLGPWHRPKPGPSLLLHDPRRMESYVEIECGQSGHSTVMHMPSCLQKALSH